MNNESEKQPAHKNEHQDLSREHLGYEPEEQTEGDPDSPYRLKSLEDKRPEDSNIKKGWTVDSNTSRRSQETDENP